MSSTQRTLALFVIILAAFSLWLHSSDKLIPFTEALFGGGGGGQKAAPAPPAPPVATIPTPTTGGGLPPFNPAQIIPIIGAL